VTGLFTKLYLAIDASAVTAASLREGLGGRRAKGFARVPLDPGALVPSPSGASLVRQDEVRGAVRRALEGLGRGRVTLVLPDGLARIALVDLPPGAEPRDYVRFRVAASLPWPASETIVDSLPAARDRVVGAALRRSTVAEFEDMAAAAGIEIERVHMAPLLALEGLVRSCDRDVVHAVLGDVALCLATFHEGKLVALRSRRRDRSSGEAARLREDLARTAALAGNGAGPLRFVLSGADATRLRHEIGADVAGRGLEGPGEWEGAAEAAWLGGLLS
jgi:hypothetical protein